MPDKPYTTTVDSLVETANADQKVPTRNVAGPPVYYPPGEMFTKRSEEGAAWQAQVIDSRITRGWRYELFYLIMLSLLGWIRSRQRKVHVRSGRKVEE